MNEISSMIEGKNLLKTTRIRNEDLRERAEKYNAYIEAALKLALECDAEKIDPRAKAATQRKNRRKVADAQLDALAEVLKAADALEDVGDLGVKQAQDEQGAARAETESAREIALDALTKEPLKFSRGAAIGILRGASPYCMHEAYRKKTRSEFEKHNWEACQMRAKKLRRQAMQARDKIAQ